MPLLSERLLSYRSRLLLYFSAVFLFFAITLLAFQWFHERHLRREMVEMSLLTYANDIAHSIRPDTLPISEIRNKASQFPRNLRLTIVDHHGRVVFERWHHRFALPNHAQRSEVVQAWKTGVATAIHNSASMGGEFFYLALRSGRYIVRVALPYDESLKSLLRNDNFALWFIFLCLPVVFIALALVATRFSRGVESLRSFVDSAERGLVDYEHLHFPKSELGQLVQQVAAAFRRAEENRRLALDNEALAAEERAKKHRFKQQMSNNIAHELRTPLAAIQGYLETLVTHRDMAESQHRFFLERAHLQSLRLSELVRDVALISNMEEAAEQIPHEALNLSDVVSNVCVDLRAACEAARLRIENQLPAQLPMVGNASLLYSVFRNLIENSIKYAPDGACHIALAADTEQHYRLQLSNEGRNIADEHLDHLFERFYRADEGRTRGEGGSGLGLSIVKNAVRWHGGTISVRNLAPRGVVFEFLLAKNSPSARTR